MCSKYQLDCWLQRPDKLLHRMLQLHSDTPLEVAYGELKVDRRGELTVACSAGSHCFPIRKVHMQACTVAAVQCRSGGMSSRLQVETAGADTEVENG